VGAAASAKNAGARLGGHGFGFGFGAWRVEQRQFAFLDFKLRKATVRADRDFRENKDAGTVYVFEAGEMDEHLSRKFGLRTGSA
jgi:hypothetical protein